MQFLLRNVYFQQATKIVQHEEADPNTKSAENLVTAPEQGGEIFASGL
jgi:hypothetical protein